MNTQEIRDELARLDGWMVGVPDPSGRYAPTVMGYCHIASGRFQSYHPHPATRDGAAAAMPEGVKWSKHGTYGRARCATYRAYAANNKMLAMVPDTGSEVHDRYALALAARKAQETHR